MTLEEQIAWLRQHNCRVKFFADDEMVYIQCSELDDYQVNGSTLEKAINNTIREIDEYKAMQEDEDEDE